MCSFDITEFNNGTKYGMHCPDEEAASIFLAYLREHGRRWRSGDEYNPNRTLWGQYRESTTYYFTEGTYGRVEPEYGNILEFYDYDWFIDEAATQNKITFADLLEAYDEVQH